jgi:hypothetical protein
MEARRRTESASVAKKCSRCCFGTRLPEAAAPYASVLFSGDVKAAWQSHAEWSRSNPMLGVSAYCTTCCQITWLADDADCYTALTHSILSMRRQASAEEGMRVLCSTN